MVWEVKQVVKEMVTFVARGMLLCGNQVLERCVGSEQGRERCPCKHAGRCVEAGGEQWWRGVSRW